MRPQKLAVVAGPTASGKSALAVQLAKHLNGEVVSADSMQVYAPLSIGTARPTAEEMDGVPHHLLGFLPLSERYSVARYVQDAHAAIADIAARGRLPILCGGTGLYIQSVLQNLTFSPEDETPALRASLRQRAEQEGGAALLAELAAVDAETAARLHPHDIGRIVRALEVYLSTGVTMSEQRRRSREQPSPYDACLLVLDCRDRAVLYDRINRRVDIMMACGLEEEARRVLTTPDAPTALQAIGYKELAPWIAGELSREEAVENLKRETRRYAKRQLSWFRRMEEAQFLYIDEYDTPQALEEAACVRLQAHGI
jgi:tRNA dimethylallyltransferase